MNVQTLSRFFILRLVFTLLGIFVLTTSTVSGAVPKPMDNPVFLVRLEMKSSADLELFAGTGLPVYARLQTEEGDEYFLLPATKEQQARLASLGFSLTVLDKDTGMSDTAYYLLYARSPEALEAARRIVSILEQEGLRAMAKASSGQAERLGSSQLMMYRLKLHPLVLSAEKPVTVPEQIEPDPVIQSMINQVNVNTVGNYDAGLSGEFPVVIDGQQYTIATRNTYATTPILKATQYTYEHFESLGLPTEFYTYTLSGPKRNVIAEQAGISQPERIFMITAHLDDTSQTPNTYAPGADDNASGSTGVLIAADILSQYSFDCTIRYALFTGEEQGLYGSYYYAQDAFNRGDDIEGVLNLDMIAYNSDSAPIIDLHSRSYIPASTAISQLFADVVSTYNIQLTPNILVDNWLGGYSDNASFWDFGYPAILGIEDNDDFTPFYHTTGDQVETIDLPYFTNFIKAAVGTMAHMGCLLEGSLGGTVTDEVTSYPIQGAQVTAERSNRINYPVQTNGDGNYLLNLATGVYTVTAQADGYVPYQTSGVQITTDVTTNLDIQLQPCSILAPDFTYSPLAPESGAPATFIGAVDPSSMGPVAYNWDFGDGHSDAGQVVTHTYTVSDTYAVTMTATNCAGMVSASHPVTVTGTPGLSVSMRSLNVVLPYGETLIQTLEIGSSGEQTLAWSLTEAPEVPWLEASSTSGELSSQERQEITLTLQAPLESGIYTTILHVQSNDPDQPEIEIPVTLNVPCTAASGLDFSFYPGAPKIGETVAFSGGVITGTLPVTYTWNFQDGTAPVVLLNGASIEHIFPVVPADQSYNVSLEAANACSAALLADHPVTIYPMQVFLPLVGYEAP